MPDALNGSSNTERGPADPDQFGHSTFAESDDPTSKFALVMSGTPQGRSTTADGSTVDMHLIDHVKVLHKRRWPAITAFLLVLGTVAVATFTATPIYEARTRVLIESDEQNVVSFKQVIEEDQANADYYQTQYNILQSRALARKTLDSLRLWEHPLFGGRGTVPESRGTLRNLRSTITQSFRQYFVDSSATPAAPDETATQSRGIDAFLSRLTIAPVRNSRLVDIKYRSPEPQVASAVANALAKSYIEQNLEYKFMASKEATDWLGERLTEQRKQVEQAEAALQRYREQNDAISLVDRENIVVQKLSDLNAAVTRAKTERIAKEARYNQLRDSQKNPAALDTFPAILTNSFIQQQKGELADMQRQHAQLSEKLGDKHPEMVRLRTAIQISQNKLAGEITKIVESVRTEYQAALSQEQSLSAALAQQKTEALQMNRKAIEYAVLEREVQSSKQIYDSLMQRAKETGISGELKTSNIRVVDAAEQPRHAVSPQISRNLLFGGVGGVLFALALVFFFEYMDNRLKSPDEIRVHLALAHLALLPTVSAKAIQGAYPLLNKGVPPNFSEAFRVLRTNLLFSSASEGPRSLAITSTGPGEGKSMVTANVAISLAQSGQRVLLIDADLRKPKAHDIFAIPQEPGLSNVLVGNAKAAESVRKTSVPGLWVLAAGRIPPNPSELLGSRRFNDFVQSVMRAHFDWVLLDSPPAMAVTDASLVAHTTGAVLFVVGAGMTSRFAAQRALEQLERANAKFVGAVLNRVDLENNAYYYSNYYKREYAAYYESSAAS